MYGQKNNSQKRVPPQKKYIPVAHVSRNNPVDVYKGKARCYDGVRRYHRESKTGFDNDQGKSFV